MLIIIIRIVECSIFPFEDSYMQYPAKMKTIIGSNSRPAKNSTPKDVSVPIAYRINLFYMGGRQKTVLRLRTLAEAWNGRLSSHYGGLEWSIDELVSAAVKADAVVFSTNCNSFNEAKIKMTLQETTE